MPGHAKYEAASIKALASLVLLGGLWMMIVPFVVGADLARANDVFFGILVVLVAGARMMRPEWNTLSWLNVLFGLWLVISPFILGFEGADILGNNVVIGALIMVLAFANTFLHPHRTEGEAHPRAV